VPAIDLNDHLRRGIRSRRSDLDEARFLQAMAERCLPDVSREREGSKVKLPRRAFLHLAAAVAALPTVTRMVWAQTYPSRPVGRRAT
jgi:hypothetical protein